MIDHTGINVADLARSKAFYQQALAPLGYTIKLELKNAAGFGEAAGSDPGGDFWISAGTPFTPRSHIAFHAASEAQVHAFHAAALQAGARDNGAPGLRPHYHADYYAAFVLDPDGYNIEAVFHGQKPR
ncbi:VOC family protein [Uliginosibacterium sp. 31-16]|uniref:VOC family protein n=1 Tax=Uliginosibacterium sp. 31-16 TaxID=3068315 RepID=UPI00273ED259|nr:VOC family protein [Uliginosibacterium sp. 31-16]MDP5241094.1 VOC family protein [Uliginosibacterium sp. 31-16]